MTSVMPRKTFFSAIFQEMPWLIINMMGVKSSRAPTTLVIKLDEKASVATKNVEASPNFTNALEMVRNRIVPISQDASTSLNALTVTGWSPSQNFYYHSEEDGPSCFACRCHLEWNSFCKSQTYFPGGTFILKPWDKLGCKQMQTRGYWYRPGSCEISIKCRSRRWLVQWSSLVVKRLEGLMQDYAIFLTTCTGLQSRPVQSTTSYFLRNVYGFQSAVFNSSYEMTWAYILFSVAIQTLKRGVEEKMETVMGTRGENVLIHDELPTQADTKFEFELSAV